MFELPLFLYPLLDLCKNIFSFQILKRIPSKAINYNWKHLLYICTSTIFLPDGNADGTPFVFVAIAYRLLYVLMISGVLIWCMRAVWLKRKLNGFDSMYIELKGEQIGEPFDKKQLKIKPNIFLLTSFVYGLKKTERHMVFQKCDGSKMIFDGYNAENLICSKDEELYKMAVDGYIYAYKNQIVEIIGL